MLAAAVNSAPYFGADVKGSISVPSFYKNFDMENNELIDHGMKKQLIETVGKLFQKTPIDK